MTSNRSRPVLESPEALPIAVADNHAHLDIEREGQPFDVEATLADAKAVGVDRLVQIGCDLPGARATIDLIEKYPSMLGGVALHPNEVPVLAEAETLDAAYVEIEELATHPRVRVVGESGLDYFRTPAAGRAAQQAGFRWHIGLAKRLDKALQIHDRDAHEDVMRILAEEGSPARTVLHCFSGDVAMAQECVERGYWLSFAGTVTFKNASGLRDALAVTPLDRLLVETDAPYLTPHPWRGAINSPHLIPLTVRAMASTLGVAVATLCEALSANSEQVYGPW